MIRPATTRYCALGIAHSCKNDFRKIRDIIEPVCHNVRGWGNEHEILAKMTSMLDAIDEIQKTFISKQQPLLMQPIWKTQGKSPLLNEKAFDIFIWSDFALSRLFLDSARNGRVSRQMRSAARLARFLHNVSTSGKVTLNTIYTEMAFNFQTDKEFSVNGKVTRRYMNCPRMNSFAVGRDVLSKIILNGGEKKLSPERRFDQTVFYTVAQIFK